MQYTDKKQSIFYNSIFENGIKFKNAIVIPSKINKNESGTNTAKRKRGWSL